MTHTNLLRLKEDVANREEMQQLCYIHAHMFTKQLNIGQKNDPLIRIFKVNCYPGERLVLQST